MDAIDSNETRMRIYSKWRTSVYPPSFVCIDDLCLSTSIVTEKYRIIICLYVIHHEREGKKEQEREIEKSIACHELQEINIYSRIKFYNESNDKLEANRICI
jgi:hypothetical protein